MFGDGVSYSLLQGCRVLDLTDEKGLLCGRILGDFGADVVKIEKPGGDPARNKGPFYKDLPHPERSLFWFYTNANKRSITLNLETAEGIDIFRHLVRTAHFVVESFEPGYMASLGLDYPNLSEINPGIIMTSITPFGQTGPYARYRTTDIVGVAMGGMLHLYGEPERPPVRIGQPQAFFQGAVQGAMASAVAHYHRELTGEGQYIDVSIQQAVVLTLMIAAELWDLSRVNYRGVGPYRLSHRPNPLGNLRTQLIFPCKDGHVLHYLVGGASAGGVQSTQGFVAMANDEGELIEYTDYDWTTFSISTLAQEEVSRIQTAFADFMAGATKDELFREALKRSVLLGPVATLEDAVHGPQMLAREWFVEVDHPELNNIIAYPGAPFKLSRYPCQMRRRAPLIGEHNQEIYYQELGLSKQQLVVLKSQGVV